MAVLIVIAVLLLAYFNGANDNFKGVATLFGSGTTSYRTALAWATVTTGSGSLMALLLAYGLVDTFKGKGLVPDAVARQPSFLLAVGLGAALTVLLATWIGLPVSTTHALTGGLIGAGLLATGGQIRYAALLSSFILPLLASPIVAMMLTLAAYPLFGFARNSIGITDQTCVCVDAANESLVIQPGGSVAVTRTGLTLQTGKIADCVRRDQGRMLGAEAGKILDALHFLSAGAVGFARGLNDTPKIVALLMAANALPARAGLGLVTVAMASGGIINARRVAETMSRKITRMSPGQGFTANCITAVLVTLASRFALPMSTTHVSVGALFGIGIVTRTAQRQVILTILSAWVTTLPLGALLAAAVYVVAG